MIADARVSLSDSGCRRHSIKQEMQESLYQTSDARHSLSDSVCNSLSIRKPEVYQTADAGYTL